MIMILGVVAGIAFIAVLAGVGCELAKRSTDNGAAEYDSNTDFRFVHPQK